MRNLDTPWTRLLSFARYDDTVINQRWFVACSAGIFQYLLSRREFDLSGVQNLGLGKILYTILDILFAVFDVLMCESCCCVFFLARPDLLSTATLQYTQRGPSQRSGPPKLARGSLGDHEVWVVRGRKARPSLCMSQGSGGKQINACGKKSQKNAKKRL